MRYACGGVKRKQRKTKDGGTDDGVSTRLDGAVTGKASDLAPSSGSGAFRIFKAMGARCPHLTTAWWKETHE